MTSLTALSFMNSLSNYEDFLLQSQTIMMPTLTPKPRSKSPTPKPRSKTLTPNFRSKTPIQTLAPNPCSKTLAPLLLPVTSSS